MNNKEKEMTMECPELKKIRSGDEGYYYCRLTERPSGRIQNCPREYGQDCEEYDRIKEE